MANARQRLSPNPRRGRDGKTIRQESVKNQSSRTRGLKRGGSPGRKKDVPNKVTREVKALAASITERSSRPSDDPSPRAAWAPRSRCDGDALPLRLWQTQTDRRVGRRTRAPADPQHGGSTGHTSRSNINRPGSFALWSRYSKLLNQVVSKSLIRPASTNRFQLRVPLAVALWAISSKTLHLTCGRRGRVAIDRHGR